MRPQTYRDDRSFLQEHTDIIGLSDGTSVPEYVLKLRIDLAMEFLADGGMSVTEIAYAAGFSSHSYFDRLFKRCKGLSPLEYRRQLKI